MIEQRIAEQEASLERLKSGAMTTKTWAGPGPWVDSTHADIELAERELSRLKAQLARR